jgi:hypothetical protein
VFMRILITVFMIEKKKEEAQAAAGS